MNTTATLPHPSTRSISREPIPLTFDTEKLTVLLESELTEALAIKPTAITYSLSARIAVEVERICEKSDRIQKSGEVTSWRLNLSRYRMDKCIQYYRLGSRRG